MDQATKSALLEKPEVVEEINKHKWIESQKAGRDLGFDFAAQDWLKKFGTDWMAKCCAKTCGAAAKKTATKKTAAKKTTAPKARKSTSRKQAK